MSIVTGEEIRVSGMWYSVLYQQMPGLWLVCARDRWDAKPILRDEVWIRAGQEEASRSVGANT